MVKSHRVKNWVSFFLFNEKTDEEKDELGEIDSKIKVLDPQLQCVHAIIPPLALFIYDH